MLKSSTLVLSPHQPLPSIIRSFRMNDSGVDEAAPIRIDEHAGECRSFAVTEVDEFPADPAGSRGGPTRSQLLGHLLLRVAPRDFTPDPQ
jgi:hypothetical protein